MHTLSLEVSGNLRKLYNGNGIQSLDSKRHWISLLHSKMWITLRRSPNIKQRLNDSITPVYRGVHTCAGRCTVYNVQCAYGIHCRPPRRTMCGLCMSDGALLNRHPNTKTATNRFNVMPLQNLVVHLKPNRKLMKRDEFVRRRSTV